MARRKLLTPDECQALLGIPAKPSQLRKAVLLAYRVPLGGPVSDEERRALGSALLGTFGAPTRPSWHRIGEGDRSRSRRRQATRAGRCRSSNTLPMWTPRPGQSRPMIGRYGCSRPGGYRRTHPSDPNRSRKHALALQDYREGNQHRRRHQPAQKPDSAPKHHSQCHAL